MDNSNGIDASILQQSAGDGADEISRDSLREHAEGQSGEGGQSQQAEAPGSQSAGDALPKSQSGWITQLPERLRDGVDTERYQSLGDYIQALRDNGRPSWTDEDWKGAEEDAKGIGCSGIVEALRKGNAGPEAASEAIGAIRGMMEEEKSRRDAEERAQGEELNQYLRSEYSERDPQARLCIEKGAQALRERFPSEFRNAAETKDLRARQFAFRIAYEVGRSLREGVSPKSSQTAGGDRDDPNRYGIKD